MQFILFYYCFETGSYSIAWLALSLQLSFSLSLPSDDITGLALQSHHVAQASLKYTILLLLVYITRFQGLVHAVKALC